MKLRTKNPIGLQRLDGCRQSYFKKNTSLLVLVLVLHGHILHFTWVRFCDCCIYFYLRTAVFVSGANDAPRQVRKSIVLDFLGVLSAITHMQFIKLHRGERGLEGTR